MRPLGDAVDRWRRGCDAVGQRLLPHLLERLLPGGPVVIGIAIQAPDPVSLKTATTS
jgi:hypothetical protein